MFILTKFADLVQIKPEHFSKKSMDAIEYNINAKYANRVIQKIGLCIALYDVLWASEGLIGNLDGYVNVNVEFRMVVFRPFKGEVMMARIRDATPAGIQLQNEFFQDIFIPYTKLPWGSEFSQTDKAWVWTTEQGIRIFYDINEIVRFQVTDEEWQDQKPAGPTDPEEISNIVAYKIEGSMALEGLGPCIWWDGDEEEEEEEEEEGYQEGELEEQAQE